MARLQFQRIAGLSIPARDHGFPISRASRDPCTCVEDSVTALTAGSQQRMMIRAVVASAVGTMIEWYDFFLYGIASALVFPRLFFPSTDPFTGTLLSFSTYFVGYQEHREMRRAAEEKWKAQFTLKRYHDTALSFGSPPVQFVRALLLEEEIPAR